ncbi:hypothetical protein [Salinimicrobium terrae]|uniref:hypothetical protein n=1 Tax=Salinimicrobium terrae TaxID=470866 RepID=UPI00041DB1E4|nr:hypothetical protein [Salinimicrobium terrae]
MNSIPTLHQYQETLSAWAGCGIKLNYDFETVCECDFDFIEILLYFESRFSLNLLESPALRQDFLKVSNFLVWITSQPGSTELYRPFRLHKPEVIPTVDWTE